MKEKNKKTNRIAIRVSDEELEKIKKEARSAGLNRSEYIRFKLGIDDKVFSKKLETFEEKQERILKYLEDFDLSEDQLIELTSKLGELKIKANEIGNSIRSYNPYEKVGPTFYTSDELYLSYRELISSIDLLSEEVKTLWESQKF